MALTEAVNEAIWLRGLLEELGIELNTVAVLKTKTVKVLKVGTEHNAADALTKVAINPIGEEESFITYTVNERSDLISDEELLEESSIAPLVVESSHASSDK
ncbi:hypothetical protein Tco_1259429 [Tanacetum coccineum]